MSVEIRVVQPAVEIVLSGDVPEVLPAVNADTLAGVSPGETGLDLLATATPEAARAALEITSTEEALTAALAQVETQPTGPAPATAAAPSSFGTFPRAALPLMIAPLRFASPIQG